MLPSWASVNVSIFCNSCVWVPQFSSVWNDGSQNHTVNVGKGSNTQKMLENQRMCGAGGFFWRTAGSWTAQDQQGTHEQLSQNIKTVVDHPGKDT